MDLLKVGVLGALALLSALAARPILRALEWHALRLAVRLGTTTSPGATPRESRGWSRVTPRPSGHRWRDSRRAAVPSEAHPRTHVRGELLVWTLA